MPSLVGNKPNQVPTNGDLGTLAFQDSNAVNITGGVVDVSAGTAALPTLGTTGDPNTGVFFPAADTVAVATNGVERVRVSDTGNVGIGTTNPNNRLQVQAGNFANVAAAITQGSGTTGNASQLLLQDGSFTLGALTAYGTAYGSSLNSATMISSNAVITSGAAANYSSSNFATRYIQANGTHQWGTAPSGTAGAAITFTESMRLNASGDLLVGTVSTNLASKFTLYQSATNRHVGEFKNGADTYGLIFYNSANSIAGSVTWGTSTTYATSSDYRLKENIAPMIGALDTVAQLKPVTYNWKVNGSAGQGFIAHELAEVVPDCVTGEKDGTREEDYEVSPAIPAVLDEEGNEITPAVEAVMGTRTVPSYQGIDTSFLVATLTAAIQEQQVMIDELKAKVAALETV
jgi:hypothetical protein